MGGSIRSPRGTGHLARVVDAIGLAETGGSGERAEIDCLPAAVKDGLRCRRRGRGVEDIPGDLPGVVDPNGLAHFATECAQVDRSTAPEQDGVCQVIWFVAESDDLPTLVD